MLLQSIHELDGAVMLNLQTFGEQPDGGVGLGRQSFDGEQRLILLRFDSGGTRGLFA